MTKSQTISELPSYATGEAEIIKFSSPMCYECKELEKNFEIIYPKYSNKITIKKIDVTNMTKTTQNLVKKYQIKLVPTCIFKNNKGIIIQKTEGNIEPEVLENYIKELLNE